MAAEQADKIVQLTGKGPKGAREKDDFYPTPPEATAKLLAVEQFSGPIWEPACGEGHISKVLEEAGHEVISSDLVNRGYGQPYVDFLMEWEPRAPNIITNPPFKMAEDFSRNALQLTTGKVAILQRMQWLEGVARKRLFESTPLARVWVFARRIQSSANGKVQETRGVLAYAWFVWEHGYQGKPTLGWL